MRILYLDDSGKIHPNDPAKVVVFAGFSVDEESWHRLIRQIAGAKSGGFPNRGNPNDWEIKSTDYLDPNSWKRAKNRQFCFAIPKILRSNGCFVYAVSLEKAKANDRLVEEKFIPLAFQRMIAKFNDEINAAETGIPASRDYQNREISRHSPTNDEINAAETGNPASVDYSRREISRGGDWKADWEALEAGSPDKPSP